MNTSSITSTTVELTGSTVKAQAEAAIMEVGIHSDFLADESNVLWFKLADGKGVGIQKLGVAIIATPGYFEDELLLTYGLEGSESFQLTRDDAQALMARVIRRARKVEVYTGS